jgi:hypothetical protein
MPGGHGIGQVVHGPFTCSSRRGGIPMDSRIDACLMLTFKVKDVCEPLQLELSSTIKRSWLSLKPMSGSA